MSHTAETQNVFCGRCIVPVWKAPTLKITFMDVTVFASFAVFVAATPRVPHCHNYNLSFPPLQLEKCKYDKILIGQKYKHQNSNTTVPIHVGLSALNSPSIGAIRQDIKNTPCIRSRYFSHRSVFVCDCTVNPAKNVANDMTA